MTLIQNPVARAIWLICLLLLGILASGTAATASAPTAAASDGVYNCSSATPSSIYAAEWERGDTPKGVRAVIENDQLAMCIGWLGDADPGTSVWIGIENQFGTNAIIQAGIYEEGITGSGNMLVYAYGGCNGATPYWRVLQNGSTAPQVEVKITAASTGDGMWVYVNELGAGNNSYARFVNDEYYSCWMGADNTEVVMACEIKDPGSRCGGTTADYLQLTGVRRQVNNGDPWTSWPMEDPCNVKSSANNCNINNTDNQKGSFFSDK